MKMQKVVSVQFRVEIREHLTKVRRHEYADGGGFWMEEYMVRSTVQRPYMLLECGHVRKLEPHEGKKRFAHRLQCYECERAAREKQERLP